jgi:cyclase
VMRRFEITVGVLLAVASMFVIVRAASQLSVVTQVPAERSFEVDKLASNLYVLRNGRSRSIVFVTSKDAILIDTNRPGWGPALREKIPTLTEKPVTTIINTHSHGGHISGNTEFPTAKEIVTHTNALDQMRKLPEFSDGRGLPNRTFTDQLVIGHGNDRVELFYFGRAHTNGDVWVLFPAARVLYTDVFIGKEMPIIDGVNGGSGIEYGDTLAKAAAAFAGRVDQIVTGHGAMATMNDLREYVDFCREFAGAVQAEKRARRLAGDVAKSWTMPSKYAGYAMPAPDLVLANVQFIFNETK